MTRMPASAFFVSTTPSTGDRTTTPRFDCPVRATRSMSAALMSHRSRRRRADSASVAPSAERNRSTLGATLAESARRRLLLWDMSAADIDRVARTGQSKRGVVVRSPVDGVVLTKNALAGMRVMPSDSLYEIGDLSRVWILADVYESELPYVRVGQTAQVTTSANPGQTWSGRVTFVSPTIDQTTRTAKVRIELDNPGGLLKPNTYADVVLQQPIGSGVVVPDSAVLQTGTRSIAFVQRGPGQFEPREIQTGVKANGFVQIRSGIQAGETVVVDANFLIDSESRLKSAISGMGNMPGMNMEPPKPAAGQQ